MHVRAKVQVHEHRKTTWAQQDTTVVMRPVHATEIPEDQRYASATPSGELTLQMKNPVAEQFALGKYLYVDFTDAD